MARPFLRLVDKPDTDHDGDGRVKTDTALSKGVRAGNRDAITALTTRCLSLVVHLATRTLGDRSEAEDIAQETFLRVWRKIDQFDPERARLESWVGRIALNLCYDRLRKKGESLCDHDGAFERTDGSALADGLIVGQQSADLVRQAISSLPARQRAVLQLYHFQGLTHIQLAETLGVSVEAVESLLARARRKLRVQLSVQHKEILEGFAMSQGKET